MRLYLKPFEPEHVPCLERWFYSGDYDDYFRDMSLLNKEQLKVYAYMKDGQSFIVYEDLNPVGFITIYEMRAIPSNGKIAILIDEKYQNQGYCLRAMILVLDYLFLKFDYEKVIIEVLEQNTRLNNMIVNGGFKLEAKLAKEARVDGELKDVIRYCMFKEQYKILRRNHGG